MSARGAAGPVELRDRAGPARGREQQVRALQRRALGPAGERLVGDDLLGVEVDDRLVDGADQALVEDPAQLDGERGLFERAVMSSNRPQCSPRDENRTWPGGAEVAVSLTFDVDAESGWLGEGEAYERRLSTLSEGRYGVVRGLPRLLEILKRTASPRRSTCPETRRSATRRRCCRSSRRATRSAITGTCTCAATRSPRPSSARRSTRGLAALKDRLGVTPRGYRSPSWELTPETFALLLEHGFE